MKVQTAHGDRAGAIPSSFARSAAMRAIASACRDGRLNPPSAPSTLAANAAFAWAAAAAARLAFIAAAALAARAAETLRFAIALRLRLAIALARRLNAPGEKGLMPKPAWMLA